MSLPQQTTLSYYPPGVSLGPQVLFTVVFNDLFHVGWRRAPDTGLRQRPLFTTGVFDWIYRQAYYFLLEILTPFVFLVSPSPSRQQFPVNLGSNNPFRTRTLSPSSTNSGGRPERPKSTNPFLDDADPISPQSAPSASLNEQQDMTQNTRDLFENLSLNPAPKANGSRPAPPRPERPQDGPLKSRPLRPTRERSEGRSDDPFNIFADPPSKSRPTGSSSRDRERRPRPRRNSESSIMERTPKLLDDDDDRRRRERRRREREGRDGRHRDGKSRSKKGNYQLDIIDKLDVTSIYGTGMFHHDGPFDACNPNRNRKGLRAAPMQAFPKDSTNMALGGAGPNNEKLDLDRFHGRMQEGYNDFAASGVAENNKTEGVSFDPTSRIEPVHGQTSMGLGTSTFLDGAPASRAAVREAQTEQLNGGGLARKKSLAQRIRGGINRPSPRVLSPQGAYASPGASTSPRNEKNPFFQDYDDAWEKKGARINTAEDDYGMPITGRGRSSSSPKQTTAALERRHTDDRTNTGVEEGKPAGGGFISRMKSLRKPPQPRRRVTDD
ncbi:Pal1 family protein [Aspergillus undulatus]|uniref:Pal1 family protein n=1 Tax=Aspergillus undulatus TaxID=1810928 RepID=UPI003CCE174F